MAPQRRCDVIIPTFNNGNVLSYTLNALFTQKIPVGWKLQVIISDDGSKDETVKITRRFVDGYKNCVVITGAHGGASSARNRGLAHASGDVVFFLGADIILQPGALIEHLLFHSQNSDPKYACIGFVQWDPRSNPTPLMEWMVHGGPQNDFDALLGRKEADPTHFFTAANISIKRSFLENDRFNEQFTSYGWEDLELGRRLAKRGLRLFILEKSIATHWHHYTLSAIKSRQFCVGKMLWFYQTLHPEEKLVPSDSGWRKLRHALVRYSGLLILAEFFVNIGWLNPYLIMWITTASFWQGIRQFKRNIKEKH